MFIWITAPDSREPNEVDQMKHALAAEGYEAVTVRTGVSGACVIAEYLGVVSAPGVQELLSCAPSDILRPAGARHPLLKAPRSGPAVLVFLNPEPGSGGHGGGLLRISPGLVTGAIGAWLWF